MLFWSVGGVLLTNAYKVYLRVNEDGGIRSVSEGLLTLYALRVQQEAHCYYVLDQSSSNCKSMVRKRIIEDFV